MAPQLGAESSQRIVLPGAKGDESVMDLDVVLAVQEGSQESAQDHDRDSGGDLAVDAEDRIKAEDSLHQVMTAGALVRGPALCSCLRRAAPKMKDRLHDPERMKEWIQDKLNNPAIVAVMLPAEVELRTSGPGIKRKMKIQASSATSFCEDARNLYVVSLDPPFKDEPVCAQLMALWAEIAGATQDSRPANGPWIWPMHRDAVSTAIMASFMLRSHQEAAAGVLRSHLQSFYSMIRHFLWDLRIIPPPGGPVLEAHLASHHGAAVAFAFFWTNLYIRGLWFLMVPTLVFYFAGAKPVNGPSAEGIPWNCLQVWTLLWCLVLSHAQNTKMSKLTADRPRRLGQLGSRIMDSSTVALGTSRARGALKWLRKRKADVKVLLFHSNSSGSLKEAQAEAIRRDQLRKQAKQVGGDCRQGDSKPKAMDEEKAAMVMQSRWRGIKGREGLQAKLKQAGWTIRIGVRFKAMNPDYKRPSGRREELLIWFRAAVVWAVVIPLFITVALSVMISFVQLNMYLAFVWGRCLDDDIIDLAGGRMKCRDPQILHGGKGWLAEVGSDVSLAIVFDVLLGEVAKALARPLVRLWNYRKIDDFRYAMVMLPLFLEALSKVGLFAVVGFLFLPQWGELKPDGNHPSYLSDDCSNLIDYKMCSAVAGCQPDMKGCCKGALLCMARSDKMDWDRRQALFEKAVKGPFMIAPFVSIIVKVIIPWVAGQLDDVVATEAKVTLEGHAHRSPTRSLARVCLRGCAGPFVRILSLIFHLDGDNVGGCGYVIRGFPFGPFRKLEKHADQEVAANQEEEKANTDPDDQAGETLDDSSPFALPSMSRMGSIGRPTTQIAKGNRLLHNALHQVIRKEFEPLDELLDLKMSFLFVTFFAPIMPIGLIPTVIARLLELRMKLTKMCFVRRRPWPGDDKLLQRTQDSFTRLASGVAVYWHVGLVIFSYNKHLHEWPLWKTFAIWFAVSTALLVLGNIFLRDIIHYRIFGYCFGVLQETAAKTAGQVVDKVEKQVEKKLEKKLEKNKKSETCVGAEKVELSGQRSTSKTSEPGEHEANDSVSTIQV